MKKLFICAAVLALTFSSCGNKTQNNAANADSTEVADTTAAAADNQSTELPAEQQTTVSNLTAELQKAIDAKDPQAAISTLANLQTIYKNLVEQGKLDEAKAYGSAIKKFVGDNAEAIKNVAAGNTTVADLVSGIANLPTSAAATAEQAKAAISADAVSLASPVIAKGETAVATAKAAAEAVKNAPAAVKNAAESAAKATVNNAKNAAEQKATETVNKETQKAADAVNKEKQKAADKVNEGRKKANEAVNKAANKALKDLGL